MSEDKPVVFVIDDSYFAGPPMQVGWEQDESSSAYMAPAGAFSAGFNALMIHVLPGLTVGSDARRGVVGLAVASQRQHVLSAGGHTIHWPFQVPSSLIVPPPAWASVFSCLGGRLLD